MKSTKQYDNEMTLSVRTGRGRCSIDLGLDHLTGPQRDFIFSSVANTLKGGSAGFGMETLESGEIVIKITLSAGSNKHNPVAKAVAKAVN